METAKSDCKEFLRSVTAVTKPLMALNLSHNTDAGLQQAVRFFTSYFAGRALAEIQRNKRPKEQLTRIACHHF